MEKYNYHEAMKDDIYNYIRIYDVLNYEYNTRDELYDIIYDELINSEMTGNNGDYYDTEEKCEEYICHNLDLAFQAFEDFDMPVLDKKLYPNLFKHPGQWIDAIIRIYLLGQVIDEVLNELGIGDKE